MESGAAFGPWVLDRKVGAGGMGEVWSATHRVLRRRIAIKILAPELTLEEKFRERFVMEAQVQALLTHPHIAQVQDFIEESGRFAIMMEWIPGGTLAETLDRPEGPLPIELTLKWARQALEALDYAHVHGVIHRDIKPGNLMLDDLGNIKVTDFGLAVALGAPRMTSAGKTVGTPRYMSPEQIQQPESVDRRTDVYSMGVVLYEMLAGQAPFDATTDYALQRLHVEAPPPALRSLNPSAPEWLEQVVLRCLAKNPDDRYVGCAAVVEALDRGAPASSAGAALAAPDKGDVTKPGVEQAPARRGPKGLSKRRMALAAVGVVAIALAAILWMARRTPKDAAVSRSTQAAPSNPKTEPPAAAPAAVQAPQAQEPAARTPAPGRSASRGPQYRSRVVIYDPHTKTTKTLFSLEGRWESPTWTRDGKYLVLYSQGGLWRVSLDGTATPTPSRIKTPEGLSCTSDRGYSFDGKWLACSCTSPASHAPQVYVMSADGGGPRQMTKTGSNYFQSFSPDGKWLAFVGQRAAAGRATKTEIYRVSFDGRMEEKLTDTGGDDDGADYSPPDGKWIYFSSNRLETSNDGWDIWRMPAEGAGTGDGKAERVTHDGWEDSFPHVSPNGKELVFLSFKHGAKNHNGEDSVEVRMTTPPGRKANAEKAKIQVIEEFPGSQGALKANCWAPDSTRFAYVVYEPVP